VLETNRNRRSGDRRLKSLEVSAAELPGVTRVYRKQWGQSINDNISYLSLVRLELQQVFRPPDMLVGANYILPAFVSFALGDERRVHQPTTIVKAELETTQYVFPFNRQLEWSQIRLGEKVISAAIAAEIDKIRKDQQKYTVIVEPEIVRTIGPNQVVVRFTHQLNTKTELVEMAKWYEEDSSVSCSVTEKARPCAHGFVTQAKKEVDGEAFKLQVELILAHQESKDEDNWSFWEDFRNGEIVAVQFVPLQSTTALVKRMEIFAENLLSDSARSGTMNGKLIKMLLGKADRPERPALRANQIGRGVNLINRLGDEQARTAELLLDDVPRVVFAQAPPGTGKTYTAASIMAAILERDPEARILALAPPNIAVTKLVEEMDKAMDNCEKKEKMLALFSGNGKIRYAQYLRRITSHLLVTAVDEEELIRALKPTEEKKVKQYQATVERNPRLAQEASVATILQAHMERRICFATLSFAEQVPNLFSGTTHVVLDESGQAPYSQVLSLMFNMPNLKKMLITGDRRQLKVHLESLPRAVRVGFGLDSVIINLDASDGIGKTALQVGYRSHPHIVQCIEAGFYRPHGERLIAGRNPEERNMLTASQLKLPKAGSPLILIHQVDEAERDAVSMSSYNPGQTWTALRILWRLVNVLPPDSSIRCICLYGTQANDIEREVQAEEEINGRVLVTTADATQGHEADVTVVVTTVSEFQEKSAEGKEPFWCDPDRVNVSLSRARHGLVLIGNLHILEQKKGWKEFLAEAKQKTIIVGQDYLDVIRVEGAQYNQEGELMDASGKSVRCTPYYAEEGRRNVSRGGYHRYNPYFYRNEEFPQLGAGPSKRSGRK